MSVRLKNNMKKRRLKFPFRIISISLLSLASILSVVLLFIHYLTTAEYFEVRNSVNFTGQNIFKVDLPKETQALSKQYPEYKRIYIRRLMPHRITVDFEPRQAVAMVELSSKCFYVDGEGVLFSCIGQENDNLQLPLIIGIGSSISHPRSGIRCNEESFLCTLEFINNLNRDSNLSQLVKIKEVNIKNINDVYLLTTAGCKINLGTVDSLNKRLLILRRLVSEINSDLDTVEYIDLRFREPVLKYKLH
jgi:hypothetical protein